MAHKGMAPVVVLGGGFGGVFTTYHLTAGAPRRARKPVTLVCPSEHFIFKPLLPEAIGHDRRSQYLRTSLPDLAEHWGFTLVQAEAVGVDLKKRCVETSKGSLRFRDLVCAVGSQVNTYGLNINHPGVFTLHELDDSARLRDHVYAQAVEALKPGNRHRREHLLRFLCVGAGPTGVETICEIRDLVLETLEREGAMELAPLVSCTLVEASGDILPSMSERLRSDVRKALRKKRITVETGRTVTEVREGAIVLDDKRVLTGSTILWAAGVRANPMVKVIPSPHDRAGRVKVDNFLRARGHINVFAIGDNAACYDESSRRPLPATGQVAVQQAKTVAANIVRRQARKPLDVFRYVELGQLVPLGRAEASGVVLGRKVAGRSAWVASRAAYVGRVLGLDNRLGLAWGWGRDAMAQLLLRPLWDG